MDRRDFLVGAVASSIALPMSEAFGQDAYPQRPITLYSGFAAGGVVDVIARLFAQKMQERLKQTVIVDTKVGASGSIAAGLVSRSEANGYSLLFNPSSSHVFYPLMATKPAYDPIKDFSALSLIGIAPTVVAVHPDMGNTLQEFVQKLKDAPGKYLFGSSGIGSVSHFSGELFKATSGADIRHVPYKGGGPAIQDLVAGRISLYLDTFAQSLPLHQSKQLRILAVCSPTRSNAAPEIPTTAEAGLPGMVSNTFYTLLGPPKMPQDLAAKLSGTAKEICDDADFKKRLTDLSVEVSGAGPAQAVEFMQGEIAKWRPVIEKVGIKIDG